MQSDGKIIINRIAADDEAEAIMQVFDKSLKLNKSVTF